jgi:hypothetical protein
MKLRLAIIMALVMVIALPVAVFAVDPLALPAYEIVSFEAGELEMVGFTGGDVEATVGFYGSSSTPTPPSSTDAPWELIESDNLTAPTGLFTEGGECMLGIDELADASEATGNPRGLFPIMLAYLLSLLLGFAVYGATHNAKMGQRGSLLLQIITSLAVMIFFYVGGCGIIPGWVLIPFGIESLFLLVSRNPQHPST